MAQMAQGGPGGWPYIYLLGDSERNFFLRHPVKFARSSIFPTSALQIGRRDENIHFPRHRIETRQPPDDIKRTKKIGEQHKGGQTRKLCAKWEDKRRRM